MNTAGRILTIGWVVLFLAGCVAIATWIAPQDGVQWVVAGALVLVWLPISFAPFAIVAAILGATMIGLDAVRGKRD